MKILLPLVFLVSLTSCLTINHIYTDTQTEEKKEVQAPKLVNEDIQIVENKMINANSKSFSKLFHGTGRINDWHKIATIKSQDYLGRHVCIFRIYSGHSPHTGVYYGSFFLNLRHGHGQSEIYGNLLCTNWGKDASTFSPNDFCVTYSGSIAKGFTSIIWKKGNSYDETWFVLVDYVHSPGITTFEFAENNYNGHKEYLPHKPSVTDGYDYIFDAEYELK
jgi:hypothetical protein